MIGLILYISVNNVKKELWAQGFHGYFYTSEESKVKYKKPDGYILTTSGYIPSKNKDNKDDCYPLEIYPLAYIDSINKNIISLEDFLNLFKLKFQHFLNSKIETIKEEEIHFDSILIYTDKSISISEESISKLNDIKKENTKIKAKSLPNDNFGIMLANKLAAIGSNLHKVVLDLDKYPLITISTPDKYWNLDRNKHPFIDHKRLYFNSLKEFNSPNIYYLADPAKDDMNIGKRTPDVGYSVVLLDEPDNDLELIKNMIRFRNNDIGHLVFCKLDTFFSKDVYPYISKYGIGCLVNNNNFNLLNLDFIGDIPLIIELDPPGLSFRAMKALSFLHDILIKVKDEISLNVMVTAINKYCIIDITKYLFDIIEVPDRRTKSISIIYKLKSEFGVGVDTLILDLEIFIDKKVKIPLVWGLDIISRNGMKRLEVLKPTVNLIFWYEDGSFIRYASIIKTEKGDLSIWSNYHADGLYLTEVIYNKEEKIHER